MEYEWEYNGILVGYYHADRNQTWLAGKWRFNHQQIGILWDMMGISWDYYGMGYNIYMGAVRKSRSQIYELMRLLCFARLLKPASR